MYQQPTRTHSRRSGRLAGRVVIALLIAGFSVLTYYASSEFNEITGQTQQVALSENQEIAMGLQAAPEMAQIYGGLHPNNSWQQHVDQICQAIVSRSEVEQTDWPFDCHLLADDETVNAFALPGGQLFITAALYDVLETDGQLASVMAHEVGHVVARHAAEQLAEQQLAQGLSGAAVMAAYDPNNPNSGLSVQQLSALISSLVTLKYGRDDELQSDRLGVRFASEAGYDPRASIRVMELLANSSDGLGQAEFFSTHPNPDNRIEEIWRAIEVQFPNGVPADLIP